MPSQTVQGNGKKGVFGTVMSVFRETVALKDPDSVNQATENGKMMISLAPHITVHWAAREGNVEMMERLLERIPQLQVRKKRLNQRDESKLAPIHYAARYNHRHMIEYLIKNGANIQAVAEDDATVLHIFAKYLKKSASDTDTLTKENLSEKESCSDKEIEESDRLSSVKLLVQSGAQVNAKDAAGQTPLHLAGARGNSTVTKELLECTGLGLEMVDNQGMTALHLACLNGHSNIVRLLVEAGADLRCRDKEMMTPMHLACSEGSLEIAEILFYNAEAQLITNVPSRAGSQASISSRTSMLKIAKIHKIKPVRTDSYQMLTMPTLTQQSAKHAGGVVLLLDMDSEKNLPLHLAVENGNLSLAEFCISKTNAADIGAMVGSLRSGNYSNLHLAVQSNSIEMVKLLLDEGADINAANSSLITPIYLACQQNAHATVKYLVQRGCDIETKDIDYMTPFLVASRYGHLETLALLIEYNADVTATDKDDKTCLMLAAEEDRADAIRLMMTNKKIEASVEEKDKSNNTALHLASMKGHLDTVKLLLEYQASAHSKNDSDKNTLHMAALHGHQDLIPELVNRDKAIISAGDEEANTALHLAAIGGHIKCVSNLILLGANIELRNATQWTPLDCACAFGFVKPARGLLEAGAAIEPSGKIKISPLHLACQRGHVEVVNLLLEWKADVTFRSIDGRNALDYAIDFGQKNCVLVLIKHPTWQDSLRNAYTNPVTGRLLTPMRKLIMKMEDMAEVVCGQCLEDNGQKPDDDDFEITLSYELLDDTYSSSQWMGPADIGRYRPVAMEEDYAVYDNTGHVTEEAYAYNKDSDGLRNNHPLTLMVNSKCETLLKLPAVTGLLNYKWRRFGRYIYYASLIFFLIYLFLLNVYLLEMPRFFDIDWIKMLRVRRIRAGLLAATDSDATTLKDPLSCIYYRNEINNLPHNPKSSACYFIDPNLIRLSWAVFVFSLLNIIREVLQLISQRLVYFNFTNVITFTLYLLTLLVTLDFTPYRLESLALVSNQAANNTDLRYLDGLQEQTGLRQQWQQEIGAFSVFLSWMVLLLFIQKLPKLGIFVVMFTDVLKTFAQFFLVLLLFILGFALAFNILFGNRHVYHHWYWSLVTTGVMMVGEINYSDIFFGADYLNPGSDYFNEVYSTYVSVVLIVIFIVVMSIIIMNLLVGLAVGDIMLVQENATLERFRMQVDLVLEVEFALPEFLRRKLCLGQQNIQINKYRKATPLKRFLFEYPEFKLEHISKYLDKEVADQSEHLSDMEKISATVDSMKTRVSDVLSELLDVKQDIRSVRADVKDAKREAKINTEDIKVNVQSTSSHLNERIQLSYTNQLETTQHESSQTRSDVDETKTVVGAVLEDLVASRSETRQLISETEERLKSRQESLLQSQWQELQVTLAEYHESIVTGRRAIMGEIEDIRRLVQTPADPSP